MTHRPARGFTLVEVLVALTVVAIAIGAGIKAAGALTMNAQRLQEVTAAQWCAENQFVWQKVTQNYPAVGDSDFTCEQFGLNFTGKLIVRPTLNPSFRRADAQVFNEAGEPMLTLSTVLGRN
jgi:general secretion pathway protein I